MASLEEKVIQETMNLFTIASIIVFGALAHATAQLKIARDKKEAFTIADFFILAFLGGFSGVMFHYFGSLMTENENLIAIITGTGSFMGVAGLNWLSVWVTDRFKIKKYDK